MSAYTPQFQLPTAPTKITYRLRAWKQSYVFFSVEQDGSIFHKLPVMNIGSVSSLELNQIHIAVVITYMVESQWARSLLNPPPGHGSHLGLRSSASCDPEEPRSGINIGL